MVLEVLFFGISSDLVGGKNISFSLSQNSSVLISKSNYRQYPRLSQINSYAIAVNENYATNETLLKENDVVAIIPPVSGG